MALIWAIVPLIERSYDFINSVPIEWRFLRKGTPLFDWRKGVPDGKMMAFHDLQVPTGFGTRGTPGSDVSLETRGIGDARVAVWLRDWTYPVPSSDVVTDFGAFKGK